MDGRDFGISNFFEHKNDFLVFRFIFVQVVTNECTKTLKMPKPPRNNVLEITTDVRAQAKLRHDLCIFIKKL